MLGLLRSDMVLRGEGAESPMVLGKLDGKDGTGLDGSDTGAKANAGAIWVLNASDDVVTSSAELWTKSSVGRC